MSRGCTLALVTLLAAVAPLAAQPAKKGESSNYVIQVKVARASLAPDAQGRLALERTNLTLPDIVTLEGTKAQYVSEKKISAGLYQFEVHAQVQRVSETKIRVDLFIEDIWSEGDREQPTIHRKSLKSVRQLTLGNKLKLALDEKNDKGEGVWVELTVKEAEDE